MFPLAHLGIGRHGIKIRIVEIERPGLLVLQFALR
jgi:hypothetical protein